MSASKLRATDRRFIDDLSDMGDGYVLDFNNQTFAEFFADELAVDIYHSRWETQGTDTSIGRVFSRSLLAGY